MAAPTRSSSPLVAAAGCGLLALAAALAAPESLFPGARLLAFAATLAFCVVGRVLTGRRRGATSSKTTTSRDPRPADGRVGLARVDGFLSEPNAVDPRFGRFLAAAPGHEAEVPGKATRRPDPGRCPPLLGRVVIVSVFLGGHGRGWSAARIARSHEALIRAGRWIEREAIRWEAPVNVEVARTYFLAREALDAAIDLDFDYERGRLGSFEKHEVERALHRLNLAALRLGFRHARHLIETTEAGIEADAVVWLLHPWLAGRSFAVPVDLPNAVAIHLAVCYPVASDLPETLVTSAPVAADPTSVVHEVFHLFGASDKYNRPLRAFRRGVVTSRDVMRLRESRLSRLRVDPETAREVGWTAGGRRFRTGGPPRA